MTAPQPVVEDFLFYEDDWMYREFERIEFVRSIKYYTFKTALNLLRQRGGKVILETGTMRMKDDPAGCSTLLFGAFCERYGGHLYTVDNDQHHMEVSRQETKRYEKLTTYVTADSVDFLGRFVGRIDLLYLDSMDCNPIGDSTISQMHQLSEFEVAEPHLPPGAVLLCDDNNFPSGGKTKLLKQYLLTRPDWECILDLGQTLWQRRPIVPPDLVERRTTPIPSSIPFPPRQPGPLGVGL